ncbi:MAG: HAD-IC family P-type ATPase [Solirubrobacterales bacterium]|nr:HAD-IC family P-type ATPase [Solirubrobacterales bacterium]MCB8969386.1 HAD-IC family P-type ATPase [Thermoleophilales bacterium]MCO5327356.1 HAD-IC family P-type ATPase [Solirubrobacterales bacterium]
MEGSAQPRGLSSAEAERRLAQLGVPEDGTTRSVASIVRANVLTLFNGIILVFFLLVLSQGLWADALFGVIAIVNSAIGIRQEVRAKETLDSLALLVAPTATVIRDGYEIELRADELVPGDVVRVEPGDQLVADGPVISSRGLTIDESLLTGEADGIRKASGDRLLSGSFAISGSGYYELDAVREDSYAEKVAGEAKEFRHPPSPLQTEVNQVLWATTIIMIPLAITMLLGFLVRSVDFTEAAQTATAGLITLIPEGLVLLMSVTLAVAARRLAAMDTLVQQMSATEALAAVDTVCVDKTGTLTDGSLELIDVIDAGGDGDGDVERALGRFAASAGERNRTLETIAEAFPANAATVSAEVPFSSAWKWSGLTLNGEGAARSYVVGAPDILIGSGALALTPELQGRLDEEAGLGRRVIAFAEAPGGLPADPARQPPPPLVPRALVVLEETLRPDAADTIEFLREQEVDLKLISGDARQTVTAVAYSLGVAEDAGVVEGPDLPDDSAELGRVAAANTIFCRITPEQKKALVGSLSDAGRFTAMIGDGVNDVPALKQARMAVAMGSGSQITKGIADIVLLRDQFSMLPRAVGEGRRIARNIHRLGRLYLTKTVYAGVLILAAALIGFTFPFLPRQLTVAAMLTIGIPSFVLALAPSEGPLYRGRLLQALAAFAVPAGIGIGIGSLLSFATVDGVFGGTLNEGRTAATTTLIVLGLAFILLLERGPGREHIAIQSYMLAMVSILGALYALILAAAPVRHFFELDLLNAGQWFLCLASVAAGLVVASALWRLPFIQGLEAGPNAPPDDEPEIEGAPMPEATHRSLLHRRRSPEG